MVKRLNSLIRRLYVPMTDEQESGYVSMCAQRVLNYKRAFLLIIIAIQMFNILYTLSYTKFRLNTVPSRVYTALYALLTVISAGAYWMTGCMKKKGSLNPKRIMHFQLIFGVILLVWGAAITVYDQRVSENISVYLIMSLTVSMMLYFTPAQALITYGALQVALLFLMPLFQSNASDGYGTRVNLTVMTLMCVFICIYRYSTGRTNYLYQQIILDKNSHLEYIANRDTLTGLRNRRFLEEEAEKQFKRCVHNRVPVTFMMIDIDSFKEYNDEYGHQQGDECLRRLAWRISSELDSEREFLVRYGGDEFLYIGFGTDRAAAAERGGFFSRIIRELVIGSSARAPMSIAVSVGVFTLECRDRAPRISLTDCVDRADQALYDAKNQGKGRVCVFE